MESRSCREKLRAERHQYSRRGDVTSRFAHISSPPIDPLGEEERNFRQLLESHGPFATSFTVWCLAGSIAKSVAGCRMANNVSINERCCSVLSLCSTLCWVTRNSCLFVYLYTVLQDNIAIHGKVCASTVPDEAAFFKNRWRRRRP